MVTGSQVGVPVAVGWDKPAASDGQAAPLAEQYGGMKSGEAKRLKEFEDENWRLKQLVADLSLANQMLKHVASKNW